MFFWLQTLEFQLYFILLVHILNHSGGWTDCILLPTLPVWDAELVSDEGDADMLSFQ